MVLTGYTEINGRVQSQSTIILSDYNPAGLDVPRDVGSGIAAASWPDC
jgi:hypothetical protein